MGRFVSHEVTLDVHAPENLHITLVRGRKGGRRPADSAPDCSPLVRGYIVLRMTGWVPLRAGLRCCRRALRSITTHRQPVHQSGESPPPSEYSCVSLETIIRARLRNQVFPEADAWSEKGPFPRSQTNFGPQFVPSRARKNALSEAPPVMHVCAPAARHLTCLH